MEVDLSKPMTQAQFGELVGVSQQAVSEFIKATALGPGVPAGVMLQAYCERLREMAAGRMGEPGGLDLVQERAALAREQRLGYEIKNAIARREYAPVGLLAETLAMASQAVAEELDQVQAALKRSCPELPDSGREAVASRLAAARNKWVDLTRQLVTEAMSTGDDEQLQDEGLDA